MINQKENLHFVFLSFRLDIRSQLKREYDLKYAELRTRLHDQYQQELHNHSAMSVNIDPSFGEQVREQIRLAQQLEKDEDERRQFFLQQTTDSEEVKRLVDKLHTEGTKEKQANPFVFIKFQLIDEVSFSSSKFSKEKQMSKMKPSRIRRTFCHSFEHRC